MASSSSSKKNKSSGLRILWIPGGRKSHPKGRYSSTTKHISYSTATKKSEVWTLGGSKAQSDLLEMPPPESGSATASTGLAILAPIACVASEDNRKLAQQDDDTLPTASSECATLPATPVTATVATGPFAEQAPALAGHVLDTAKTLTSPVVVTTVEILELHNTFNLADLPKVPSFSEPDLSTSAVVLNSSAGTTASITTNSSPTANRQSDAQASTSLQASPQKGRFRNHNNNHEDINSIESIDSSHVPSGNFDWIDKMVQDKGTENMHKLIVSDEHDQLDGKLYKQQEVKLNNDKEAKLKEENYDKDEKVVKCLYYSLMCCDCSIS